MMLVLLWPAIIVGGLFLGAVIIAIPIAKALQKEREDWPGW